MAYDNIPSAGETIAVTISATPTTIPGVTKLSWDGFSRAERNPKPLSSTHVKKKRGLPNFGELKVEGEYDPNEATHIYLRDAVVTQAIEAALDTFTVTKPDPLTTHAKVVATGFVKEFNVDSGEAEAGIQTFSCTIAVDSATFTAGS